MAQQLRIATSQFPVSSELTRNKNYVENHMREASRRKAQVIHFPESALSGYGPAHYESFEDFPWTQLEENTQAICALAASLNLWVVLGTMRQIEKSLPRNCLLVVSNKGKIEGVYDKRRLYGKEKGFYSHGQSPLLIEMNGFRCGFLICFDNCFPELYAEYRELGVKLLFHAFHNAGNAHPTSIEKLMEANCIVRAADHQMWIVASNSSKRYSPLRACIVRPDGTMVKVRRHVAGITVDDFPTAELGWTYDNREYSVTS